MTKENKQEQAPARAEKPAPAGTAEQPKGPADRKKAIAELTDADPQGVSGGGSKPGITSGAHAH